ncbi:Spo0B domain-containing protein [Thermobrachium celere]|uniref:Spo0B domain-containing protein n=1 Tax=Thermobrachium celere TaxID=53422 RepID=UPI001941470D|nr:Spo0B domain-containing protein [Thermobrachium celere]GFR36287.1 hypothetical protein TCEA9_20990 [Thermobrachium celere]
MENDKIIKWCINQSRRQRHDFMNYLQVIFGYLQINKPNEALNYIKKINNKMVMLSQIYNLESSYIALIIQDIISIIERCGLEWHIKSIISYISDEEITKNINKYFDTLEKIKNELMLIIKSDFKKQEIYITVYSIDNIQYILLTNTSNFDDSYLSELNNSKDLIHKHDYLDCKAVLIKVI